MTLENRYEGWLARTPEKIEEGMRVLDRKIIAGGEGMALFLQDRTEGYAIAGLKGRQLSQSDIGQIVACEQLFRSSLPPGAQARSILVAPSIPASVKEICKAIGVETKEIPFMAECYLKSHNATEDQRELFYAFREAILALDDRICEPESTANYIAFKYEYGDSSRRSICHFHIKSKRIAEFAVYVTPPLNKLDVPEGLPVRKSDKDKSQMESMFSVDGYEHLRPGTEVIRQSLEWVKRKQSRKPS